MRGGRRRCFPRPTVKMVDGMKVGFIGLALQGTPSIVSAAFVQGLTFSSEVAAGNAGRRGAGGAGRQDDRGRDSRGRTARHGRTSMAASVTGPIVDIANQLSPDIDVIVSGHSHRAYVLHVRHQARDQRPDRTAP